MKIGFDAFAFNKRGGASSYVRMLVTSDALRGCEFLFVTALGKTHRLNKIFDRRKNITYRTSLLHPSMLGHRISPFMKPLSQKMWKRSVADVDIVHFLSPFRVNTVGIEKFVVTLSHMVRFYDWLDYEMMDGKNKALRSGLGGYRTIQDARLIFVPSQFVKNEVVKYFPEVENRIRVVYIAPAPWFRRVTRDNNILKKYGISRGESFFLYVGSFGGEKNLKRLVKAFASLPSSMRNTLKLVCIGESRRSEADKIYEEVQRLSISERFVYKKNVPDSDLVQIYNAASACIYVPPAKGFGFPVLEAMQSGCPVVVSKDSPMAEIAQDAALQVDPWNIESIRDGMLQLMESPALREALIETGLQRVKNFSWEKAAQKTLEGYQAVLNGEVCP